MGQACSFLSCQGGRFQLSALMRHWRSRPCSVYVTLVWQGAKEWRPGEQAHLTGVREGHTATGAAYSDTQRAAGGKTLPEGPAEGMQM